MSSNNEPDESHEAPETMSNQSSKRDANSLFVTDDEVVDRTDDRGNKRFKASQPDNVDTFASLDINEDGKVAPYDAFASEGRPCLAIYHPSFKEAEKMVFKICNEFLGVVEELKKDGYQNAEVAIICEKKLKEYRHVKDRYPSIGPIACLGPAGVGKSSAMNCFLHQSGAAPESDSAHRGTNLVHEFSAACTEQTSMYQVAAPYYREAQIEGLVRKYCQKIFAFLNQTDNDYDEDEVDELRKDHDTGIEFFRILLCNLPDFVSNDEAEAFFESRQSEPEEKVVRELKKHVETFKKTRPLVDGIEYYNAETVKELADVFRLVSRVPKATGLRPAKPHPWPIIPKIQIRQDNDLLNAGIVLGDTPGVTDSNQAVVENTSKYIRKAGTVLVFESFKRIADSETLDANLRKCIQLGKMSNTHLIVTMIDNGQSIKEEDRVELSESDLDRLEAAEEVVSKLKSEEKIMKQTKAAALTQSNANATEFEELRNLIQSLENMPTKIALAEARVGQVAIEIRTREVANELKGKLRKLERSKNAPDLSVHFISNTQYQKHQSGYEARNPPTLDIEGTGIPQVRRMLYSIPARGMSSTLSRMCRVVLPHAFKSVMGVLTKSQLERKHEVEKLIISIMGRHTVIVEDTVIELRELFTSRVSDVIVNNKRHWEEKVDRLVRVWEKYRPVTFAAFCRRSGFWRAKRGEEWITWNEKIQNVMAEKLAIGFDAFDDDILSVETNVTTDVAELFKKLETELDVCEDFQGVGGAQTYFTYIRTVREVVLKDFTKVFHDLRERVRGIRHASTLDQPDSYVAVALQPTYEQCLALSSPNQVAATGKKKVYKKSNVHGRRVEHLRQKLSGTGDEPSVFASVSNSMRNTFDDQVADWKQTQYARKLQKAYDLVVTEFNRSFVASEEVKKEENVDAVQTLQDAVNRALATIEGPLKEHLDRFEALEKSGGW